MDVMCVEDRDICELTQELTNRLIGVGAMISQVRRAALSMGASNADDLRAVDKAFEGPLEVARQLSMAVHVKCDKCSSPRG
jgi:hypothetical protein